MGTKFKQIHLADMEHGLAKLLAVVGLSPKQLSDLTGISFETAYEDGFDYVLAALLVTDKEKQFSLRQYYRIRRKYPDRTELVGSEYSKNPVGDAIDFLNALGIQHEFVLWRFKGDTGEAHCCPN